ncbi:hypothetical protein LCGC14_1225140 [marine sediment metagenome]|uniref:Uncharacterized protein n=1 Tax=marine sediment metagenome TaxID=412755 RepID=A0A0F9NSI5_9ZZZZ
MMPEFTILLTVVDRGTLAHRASLIFSLDMHEASDARDAIQAYLEDLHASKRPVPSDVG